LQFSEKKGKKWLKLDERTEQKQGTKLAFMHCEAVWGKWKQGK